MVRTAWLTALALLLVPAAGAARAQDRPNVLVVMTDDQTLADMRAMPRTRTLVGAAGVTFRRAYASTPQCCPARATMLTGRYAQNTGVYGNTAPQGGYQAFDRERHLGTWLQRSGYRTVHVGKFLNGYLGVRGDGSPDVVPGWSRWLATHDPSTYNFWGFTINDDGRPYTVGRLGDRDSATYSTNVLTDLAVREVEAADDRPWYVELALVAPHSGRSTVRADGTTPGGPPAPDPVDAGSTDALALPKRGAYDERDLSDKPRFMRRWPRMSAADEARVTRSFRARRASLAAVDRGVERLVTTLQRTGQLERTYVVFTSDNGFFAGEHRVRTGKYLPYEPSAHVPLLVRGPGIPAGTSSDELVVNADLAPTVLEAAGASADVAVDGRSLLPYARDVRRRSSRPLLLRAGKPAGVADEGEPGGDGDPVGPDGVRLPGYTAIRADRWLYVRWQTSPPASELYDLVADPQQLRSLHRSDRHAALRRRLDRELRRLQGCRGTACRRSLGRLPPLG